MLMQTMTRTDADKPRAKTLAFDRTGAAPPILFARRANNGATGTEEIPLRIREIAMLRGLGFTFREIGAEFGISPQAVSLMLARHRRTSKSLGIHSPLRGLSPRAVNVLGRHSIRTRDEARARNILAILSHERNCGKKTADEIERWMAAEAD